MTQIRLTKSQDLGLKHLLGGTENIFLTGGPGTGKSFLIREYLKKDPSKIPVIASTGAAAILVGGRTFHSFFGLGILQGGIRPTIERALKNRRLKKRLKEVSVIVIDEVSMLSADTLDCAERLSGLVRENAAPWGGIRVIAVGDFAQLPPIARGNLKPWCFQSAAWKRSLFKKIVLDEVKRTEDRDFLEILEEIRWGRVSERVRAFLDERVMESHDSIKDVPHLFPRRAQTDAFNKARLDELDAPAHKFETEYGGNDPYLEKIVRDSPVPPVLELKEKALVMLRMNDPKQRFVNGSVGVIQKIKEHVLIVEINGRNIEVEPFTFSMADGDGQEVAYAINFPVNLAYASTIHKIQGTTLERAHISLENLWEPGQAYVALSRARSGNSITLSGWDIRSIMADETVQNFYEEVDS